LKKGENSMNRFTHFELATNDLEKTAQFYREVFGWKIEKWEGPIEYWLVTTGDEKTPGINGGLMAADGGMTGTINTLEVADIDAAIAKALAYGGEVALPKGAIPGVGYQAYIKDNTGIIVGLHQADPKAGMG
jgi:predicted enzyme related to lactoylglutathione lyase